MLLHMVLLGNAIHKDAGKPKRDVSNRRNAKARNKGQQPTKK